MKIYVLGNPLVKEDSVALRIAKKLKKKFPRIKFEEFDTSEDLKEREVWFMDVVEGIKRVRIIDDFELMKTKKIFSLHDYDLSYEIKLLKKIGKLKKAFLIAIPYGKKEKEVLKDVENQIHLILKK